jgi:hypothetical protein
VRLEVVLHLIVMVVAEEVELVVIENHLVPHQVVTQLLL